MRKFLIPVLLASALAPATAYAERGDRDRSSESKSENRAERSSKADRPARVEKADKPARVERADRPARTERAERPARVEHVERADHPARIERVERINRESDGEQRVERRTRRPVIQAEPVREVRAVEPVQQVQTSRSSGNRFVDGIRDGIRDHDELKRRERNRDRWSGDWRHDGRYDWYNYRNRYGSLFRVGRYYDPYGWGYRRFSTGFSIWPSYYGSNYWLNDPWQYRLPPAYGPYRWVRYYDDALLVDIYTGQVVDVVHNFFW